MPSLPSDRAEVFLMQVEEKIRALLREYSEGHLNSEQFHVIYERYAGQRLIAQQAMLTGDDEVLQDATAEQSTIAIKDAHMGKALGLRIYHHQTGALIETLGEFDVSAFVISPVLSELLQSLRAGKVVRSRAERLEDRRWLLFTVQPLTSVVTLFRNEPSPLQVREIQRLHEDFEAANEASLNTDEPDAKKLAYPFYAFVQRKYRK